MCGGFPENEVKIAVFENFIDFYSRSLAIFKSLLTAGRSTFIIPHF
jgi:hypothetical protein